MKKRPLISKHLKSGVSGVPGCPKNIIPGRYTRGVGGAYIGIGTTPIYPVILNLNLKEFLKGEDMPLFKESNIRPEKDWKLIMSCCRKEPCSTCDRSFNINLFVNDQR
jgi:hypothetical protein